MKFLGGNFYEFLGESQTAVPMPENFGADKQQHRTVLLAGVPKKPSLKRWENCEKFLENLIT